MDRNKVLNILQAHTEELRSRQVKTLVLFGPVARGEGQPGSEVDFLLELHPPVTFDRYREVREYIGGLLGSPVEVSLASPYHPSIWPLISEEAIFLF